MRFRGGNSMKPKDRIMKRIACLICFAMIVSMIPVNGVYAAQHPDRWYIEYDAVTDDGFYYSVDSGGVIIKAYEDQGLEHLDIPAYIEGKPVTRLSLEAFLNCSFKTVTIPDTVTRIAVDAFANCESLESVYIPDSVKTLDGYVFNDCTSLKSVRLPQNISAISRYLFKNCCSLDNVVIPSGVTEISESAFYDCTSLTNIDIPDTVIRIDTYAFGGCTSLESIDLPDNLEYLGWNVFNTCTALKSIEIPAGVDNIQHSTFNHCTSLESVTLYDKMRYIDDYAFRNCYALKDVYFNGAEIYYSYIKFGKENDYFQNAEIHFPDVPEGLIYKTENGEVTVQDYEGTDTQLVIPAVINGNPVTKIDKLAFAYCTGVKKIILPDTIKTIGDKAFNQMTSLESVHIPKGITVLNSGTFYNCTALKNVSIPDSVTSIGMDAFFGCNSIEHIALPEKLSTIGMSAFQNCTALKSIEIPAGVTAIEAMAFYNCTSLESITLPENITKINQIAFTKCSSLKEVNYNGTAEQWSVVNNSSSELKSVAVNFAHTHEWNVKKEDANCFKTGTKYSECACGEIVIEEIPLAAHTEVTDSAIDATCTLTGKTEGKHCSVCDVVIVEQITVPVKDHSYEWVVVKEANVDEEGLRQQICRNCKNEGSSESIPKLDKPVHVHKYTQTVTAPTCIKEGYTTYICECGDSYTGNNVRATGHVYGDWKTEKEATCKTAGTQYRECSVCEKKERVGVKALGHNKVDKNYKMATCTSAGWYAYEYCSRCDYTTYEEIPARGHSYKDVVNPASFGKNGSIKKTCTVCKKVIKSTSVAAVVKPSTSLQKSYTGKTLTYAVKIKDTKGNVVKTVKVTGKNVGTFKKTVKLTGKYSGSVTLSLKINPKGTNIKKLTKPAKKQLKVTWKKQNMQTTGYQIRYSTKANMTGAKTKLIAKPGATSVKLTGLKAKTKYYVQIRTYKTVKGEKYYSAWSNKKSQKTK